MCDRVAQWVVLHFCCRSLHPRDRLIDRHTQQFLFEEIDSPLAELAARVSLPRHWGHERVEHHLLKLNPHACRHKPLRRHRPGWVSDPTGPAYRHLARPAAGRVPISSRGDRLRERNQVYPRNLSPPANRQTLGDQEAWIADPGQECRSPRPFTRYPCNE